jgi:hypothetical protein
LFRLNFSKSGVGFSFGVPSARIGVNSKARNIFAAAPDSVRGSKSRLRMTNGTALSEAKSLKLIVEAVRYCKRGKRMGVPPSCYTKALREPVYFLWTRRVKGVSKDKVPEFRSKASLGLKRGNGQLIFDHAVPFRVLQDELLELKTVTREAVRQVLRKHEIYVLITKEEDKVLNVSGLQSQMPRT